MNRPSNSASSASWRLVIGSTSTESLLGDAGEMLDRGRRRRRHLLVRIVEHREVVFGDRARFGIAPFALGVIVQRLAEELGFAVGEPGDVARADAVDREPVARVDDDFERRAAEPVEQQPAERFEAVIAGDAETDQQPELGVGLEIGAPGAAVELVLELRQRVLVELLLAQLQHGLDGRHDAMAARLGQERGVIALRLVGVGAGEIDQLRPPHLEQARPRQVLGRGDDLVRGLGVGQIAGLVDKDDPAGHGWVPFQSKARAKGPIMRSRSGKAQLVIAGNETNGDSAVCDVHHESRFARASQIFLRHGRRRRVRTERLLETQRVAVVVIIISDACRTVGSPIFRSAQSPGYCAHGLRAASPPGRRRLAPSSAAASSNGPTPRRPIWGATAME